MSSGSSAPGAPAEMGGAGPAGSGGDGPPPAVWIIAGAVLAVLAAAGALSFHYAERPFVRYNLERLAALAADRPPEAAVVVALGASRLRHATLDEAAMAEEGARRGMPDLRFLRIVHNSGQFADFEPFLDAVLGLRPRLVLLELDLLFKERRTLPFYHHHLRALIDAALRGRPLRADPAEEQFAKPCARAGEPEWDGDAGRLDRFEQNVGREMRFSADSPGYDRVRRFVLRAGAQGTRVAVLQLRSRPVWEARAYGPGNAYRPDALERVARDPAVTLWRYPDALQRATLYCDYVHLTGEGRVAYSAWLLDRIAAALRASAGAAWNAPAAERF